MLGAGSRLLLILLFAMGMQASPCGYLKIPCKVLNQTSIFFVGKVLKEEPYEGPKVTSEDWGPLRKFTLQIDEPLYGLQGEKEIVAIASGFPYSVPEGLFWLKRRDYGVVVSETPSNCVWIDPKFFKNTLAYLRKAKKQGRVGARIRGALSFQEKPLANILVKAVREDKQEHRTRTNRQGEFQFSELPPGLYRLGFESEEYRVRREEQVLRVDALSCPDTFWSVEVEEILGSLSGRVVGLPHALIDGARLRLTPLPGGSGSPMEARTSFAQNGQFSFSRIQPGEYEFQLDLSSVRPREIRLLPHASEGWRIRVDRRDQGGKEVQFYDRKRKRIVFQFLDEQGQALPERNFEWGSCAEGGSGNPYLLVETNQEGQVETDLFDWTEYSLCWSSFDFEEAEARPLRLSGETSSGEVSSVEASRIPVRMKRKVMPQRRRGRP